ncbi:MAG: hypothetical protein JSW72_02935 [Candidatus Bathyarchaeota archaeon]|nr:MAG: hypothetical protein JSW72_02935 [Candidatus Bathyarchaeota archaeon]
MTAELERLQDRRVKLTKELKLLSERESFLLAKLSVLEGKSKIRERMETPQRFGEAQKKLRALEDFVENEKGNFNLEAPLMIPMFSRNPTVTDGTPILREDSNLNTVRLKQNMILSWSYKKLP